jgi:hypothetical protein
MYGFSGYATNVYASERETPSAAPLVVLGMRIVANSYGVMRTLVLRFRTLTLSNPSSNQRTLEL